MEVTFQYGRVSGVAATETWKTGVEVDITSSTFNVKKKNKLTKSFKLIYFTLHKSHVAQGKISLSFQKDSVSVLIDTSPAEAQSIVDDVVEAKGTATASAALFKRPHQSYSELTIQSTPVKKKPNTFASPHKISSTFSPSVQRLPVPTSPLSWDQRKVIECVLNGASVFFTGGAGTGKSFLLKKLVNILKPETTVVTASTGVAACHLNGITLHQWGGIGIGEGDLNTLIQKLNKNTMTKNRFNQAKTLIIDEISMVDGEYFDKLEAVVRAARGNSKPWGGLQLVICGDFLQLPPAGKSKAKFCFEAESWKKSIHKTFLLKASFRQAGDKKFIEILSEVRLGRCSPSTAAILGGLIQSTSESVTGTTRLLPLRADVETINNQELAQLPGEPEIFIAKDEEFMGNYTIDDALSAKKQLALKVGALVILTKTLSIEDKLVNGAVGTISRISSQPRCPVVKFALTGKEITISPQDWILSVAGREVARRRQIPLELAWGVSIHKSQGMTIDACELNIDGIFEYGQAYVGMSRCRSLEGLKLISQRYTSRTIANVIKANPKCLAFYESLKENTP
jgi:ATP-dependent DNA helicase PIF1